MNIIKRLRWRSVLNPTPLEIAQQEALAALDRALEVTEAELEAIEKGAPSDGKELVAALDEASAAVKRWADIGGVR